VVGVERFRGPDIMRDDRIVYYQSPTQLNFYQQHRWSADPTAMLAEPCQRWLEQTGSSPRFGWHLTGSPGLRGRVLDFAEVDDQPGSKSASASNSLSSTRATGKWYFRVAPGRGRGSGKECGGRGYCPQ
jgi:hypothetical protein